MGEDHAPAPARTHFRHSQLHQHTRLRPDERHPLHARRARQAPQDKPLEFEPGAEMRYEHRVCTARHRHRKGQRQHLLGLSTAGTFSEPLGMKDSGYDDNATVLPRRAAGYSPSPKGNANAMFVDMTTPFAAGTLYPTVEDLLRWERALFGKKLLADSSLEKMTTKGKGNYGLGVGIQTESGRKTIEHGGGIPASTRRRCPSRRYSSSRRTRKAKSPA